MNATGEPNAAGIGGTSGVGGNVTINGGIITATGSSFAAGIGGGTSGNCGNVTINGGDVTATGGLMAVGIGGGLGATNHGDLTVYTDAEIMAGDTDAVPTKTKLDSYKDNRNPRVFIGPYALEIATPMVEGKNVHGVQAITDETTRKGTLQFGWELFYHGNTTAPASFDACIVDWYNLDLSLTPVTDVPTVDNEGTFCVQVRDIPEDAWGNTISAYPFVNGKAYPDFKLSGNLTDSIIWVEVR